MLYTSPKVSLSSCLQNLHHNGQQTRVSAKLYQEVSKNLFRNSGDSHLQVLHPTYEDSIYSVASITDQQDLPDNKAVTGLGTGDLSQHGMRLKQGCCPQSNRQVKTTEELKRLENLPTRLRGYVIPQDESHARLKVTRSVYDALQERESISQTFNDTIMYMGYRRYELEISPPPIKWQYLSTGPQGWQCSLMLRYAARNNRPGNWPWSLRQFAIYSRCDTKSDDCLYTFVAPPPEVLDEFKDLSVDTGLDAAAAHTLLMIKTLQNVLAGWRPFIVWITNELAQISLQITFNDPFRQECLNFASDDTGENLRILRGLINDTVVALKANKSTVSGLRDMWSSCTLLEACYLGAAYLSPIVNDIDTGIEGYIIQLQNLQQKAQSCAETNSNYRDLASSILLQKNGQSLQNLAVATQKDSEATVELSKQAQADAKAVKALTFVALVFLPISVVLNFFSTSLYETSETGILLKPYWWIFLALGIPLTILTLLSWKVYVFSKRRVKASRSKCRQSLVLGESVGGSSAAGPKLPGQPDDNV